MEEEKSQWYALQAIHGRTLIAEKMFAQLGIETFVPMEKREIRVKGKKVQQRIVPILRNLIFAKTTLQRIIELKSVYSYLWYLTRKEEKVMIPIVVPDDQMESFIKFTTDRLDQIEYIDSESLDLRRGEKVKILSGAFAGQQATLVKVTGRRSKQIVMTLDDVLVVAIKADGNDIAVERL